MDFYERLLSKGYSRPSYWNEPSAEPLLPATIGQLTDWAAEQWEDHEAFISVYENIRLTFREARDKSNILAAGILKLGMKPGDRIAIWGYNSSTYFLTVLAAARAGLILTRIIPGNEAPEILYALKKVEVKALIAAEVSEDQNYYELIHSIAPELSTAEPGQLHSKSLPDLNTVIFTGKTRHPGTFLLSDIYDLASSESLVEVEKLKHLIQPDFGAAIHYTSGTTGYPKGVLQSHLSLVNNAYVCGLAMKMDRRKYRLLAQLQLCHIATNVLILLPCLRFGSTMVLPSPKYDPKASIKVVQQERCEIIMGAPGMYIDTLSLLKEHNIMLDYPRIAIITGAPCPTQLEESIKQAMPVKECVNLYGMTEVGVVTMKRFGEQLKPSSVGKFVPHIEVKVVNEEGLMVPFGKPGEIYVRGYSVMLGYWNDEEATKRTITSDGWLKTGDTAVIDEDGSCKVVGRIKEAIIRESINVFPMETEEFFRTHKDVLDVVAFGVPDIRYGEEMCVYIKPQKGKKLSEQEMFNFCKGKMADYRIPRYIRFVEDFPRTAIGKVDKKVMISKFKENDEEFIKRNKDMIFNQY